MFNLHCSTIMAQEKKTVSVTDTIVVDSASLQTISSNVMKGITAHRDLKTFKPDPIRAMWLGLVLPGAGQFYNRKYWKLPIVYGGFLGCVYALTWNGQMLSDYSQAYLDIMDTDPNTKSYEKMLPPNYSIVGKEERFKGIFKSKKDTFRRFRDLSIFSFAGVYLLSVIDAYVDAELSTFDISHDLSLEIQPTFIETGRYDMNHRTTTPGVQCVINF
ncbi:MAG: hypothetical protein J6W03_01670 [Bacteroidaceae bacterium]|nr:hypothetical protein [Bacteroidaceae bacterium]